MEASLGRALRTADDYKCEALDAHPRVRHVKVVAIDGPGVEVRVTGRFWRALPRDVVDHVHRRIVARHPVTVRLKVVSP